jgi:putative ABC transport system ATP-binding protein
MGSAASVETSKVISSGALPVAVRVEGITKHFGTGERRVTALREVDLDVYAGQMSLIVGPSGCGKTTLLSVIAGILNADQGAVTIFGREVSAMSDRARTRFRAGHIGFVFQQYNLLPALTAAENAAIPLVIAGWSKAKAVDRAKAVLSSIGMEKKTESYPNQLSGGQQQRVAIARALVNEPVMILADEATGNLDSRTSYSIMALLQDLNQNQGKTIVFVTHEPDISSFSSRTITLRDGKIIKDAPNENKRSAKEVLASLPTTDDY